MSDLSRIGILIYTIYMILFMIGLSIYIKQKTGDSLRGKVKMPKNRIWIFILGSLGTWIVLIYTILYICFPDIIVYTLPVLIIQNIYFKIIGILLLFLGTVITTIAMVQLGISVRVYIPNAKTKLISSGLYRFCRNPGYLGVHMSWFGIFILVSSLFYFIGFFLFLIGMHFRILQEEKFLKERFGEEYEIYMEKVVRYFPKIKKRRK